MSDRRYPLRENRTTEHPGLRDAPPRRRTTAEVAVDREKNEDAIATKARRLNEKKRAAAQVEEQVRISQREDADKAVRRIVNSQPKMSYKRPPTGSQEMARKVC